MSDPVYNIHIIDEDRVTMGVLCDDIHTEAEALNLTYFYLGRLRADAARLYGAYDEFGNVTDLVAEITPPTGMVEHDRELRQARDL